MSHSMMKQTEKNQAYVFHVEILASNLSLETAVPS